MLLRQDSRRRRKRRTASLNESTDVSEARESVRTVSSEAESAKAERKFELKENSEQKPSRRIDFAMEASPLNPN